jgi:opacity protein-like surface antigen
MTGMSRRGALVASLGLAAAPVAASPNPDAELIHWCGVYVAACAAYNASSTDDDGGADPMWDAIMAAEAEIDARPPQTLASVIKKARVAIQLLKQEPEERSDWGSLPAGSWAREVVLDLARLFGESTA